MELLTVAAITGGKDVPSARFRIRQYRSALADNGIDLVEYCPFARQQIRLPGMLGRIRRRYLFPWLFIQMLLNIAGRIPAFVGAKRADVSLINRSVLPGLEECVNLLPRPRVLDVDDAIWLTDPRGEKSAARLARRVEAVIAGNEYLAEWYQKHNKNVFVVPTGVDTDYYKPVEVAHPAESDHCTIGWMGTSGNFSDLEMVRPAVKAVMEARRGIRFLCVSDRRPEKWDFDGRRCIFRKWSEATELRDLQDMDIGLMPLVDNEWTRGKCSFKMLQYLSARKPVVVSPVGMNSIVLGYADVGFEARRKDDWAQALLHLCDNDDVRRRKGMNGRDLVERLYSSKVVANRIAMILRDVSVG